MLYSSEMSKVSACKSHICGVKCDGASFSGLSLSNISNGKSVQGSAQLAPPHVLLPPFPRRKQAILVHVLMRKTSKLMKCHLHTVHSNG
jgi:hypothetical protein